MLAAVIEVNSDHVILQDETGQKHHISNDSDDFESFVHLHSTDSYFEFDPIEKMIIPIEDEIDIEDYSLPNEFN